MLAAMKCKKDFDGRKLPRDAKAQLRVAAVRRVEAGESPEVVASGMGFNRRAVYRWLEAFHYGGEAALGPKPIPGAPPKLDANQMAKLSRIIRTKNPLQLRFAYALWTLAMIREVIKQQFGVSLSEVSVGRLMRRLGFSPQRPLHRAWQQDPVAVDVWRTESFPKIAKRAKREGAVVFFADESGIRSDYHAGTSWGPVGQTLIVKATGARFGCNMLSAVSAVGVRPPHLPPPAPSPPRSRAQWQERCDGAAHDTCGMGEAGRCLRGQWAVATSLVRGARAERRVAGCMALPAAA
jgi:transposase